MNKGGHDMSGEWSLVDIYPSYDSQEYKDDWNELEKTLKNLEETPLEDTVEAIRKVVHLLEKTSQLTGRLYAFSSLQLATNTTDAISLQHQSKLEKLLSSNAKLQTRVQKFLGSVQTNIAEDDYLSQYAFYFEQAKENFKHTLSDEVEEVIATMNLSAGSAWSQHHSFVTSTMETKWNGQTVNMSEVRNLAYSEDAQVRKSAYEAELAMYEPVKEVVAFSLNYIKSQVNDITRLRGYDSPLEATLASSRMSRQTLDALMEAIKESLPAFRRYLKHKATLLGHSNGLPFYDLFAPIGDGQLPRFTVEESKAYLIENFSKFSQDMADMTEEFYDGNYIDFFPRKGKVGGAFCYNLPYTKQSRILTNFDGSLSDVVTLAHELGHAYHGLHIENELPLNRDYSMPVAETASTFNEAIVMNNVLSTATDAQKVSLLESLLQDTTQIIVDIYSRYLFETEVFEKRKEMFLFSNDLEQIMIQAQKDAYGDGLDEQFLHPFMWICKPHYYSEGLSFYNFPYAFGGLFSKGLYALYASQPDGFVEKYQEMLRATTKTTVEDTAKVMGVDVSTKEFWKLALKQVEQQIDEFISLTSKG